MEWWIVLCVLFLHVFPSEESAVPAKRFHALGDLHSEEFLDDDSMQALATNETTNVDNCLSDLDCVNGKICRAGLNGTICECPPPYKGENCEIHELCEKLEPNCLNMGAVCLVRDSKAFCRCPPGKTVGLPSGLCEDVCNADKCVHGTCEVGFMGSFTCRCKKGYTGKRCEEKIQDKLDNCLSDLDCVKGKICRSSLYGKFCECPPPYKGEKCQINELCEKLEPNCLNMGAECLVRDSKAFCRCPPGQIVGLPSGLCEDVCKAGKCVHGTCEEVFKGSFRCKCKKGYTGDTCEEKIQDKLGVSETLLIILVATNIAVLILQFGMFCFSCINRRN